MILGTCILFFFVTLYPTLNVCFNKNRNPQDGSIAKAVVGLVFVNSLTFGLYFFCKLRHLI